MTFEAARDAALAEYDAGRITFDVVVERCAAARAQAGAPIELRRETPQQIIDRYHTPAVDRAWADHAAGRITADQAIDRCHAAWLKTAARIKRETGYTA